jgi:hypothetical protein
MSGRLVWQIVAVFISTASVGFGQNNRSAVSISGNDMAFCTVPDPCRTFGVALSKTNSGGELVVLSTAGYGPFTVSQSVSIITPPANHAAIAPTSGAAITVNAPGSTVILRNLYLNSLGGFTGVSITSDSIVHIEGLVVNGFLLNGISAESSGTTAEVFVKDTEIRGNGEAGIYLGPTSGTAIASIDHVRLERNNYGVAADSGVSVSIRDTVAVKNTIYNFFFRNAGMLGALRATIENTLAADSLGDGFAAIDGARVTVRDSAALRNFDGFRAAAGTAGVTAEMAIDHCLAAENGQGIYAGDYGAGGGLITVSNSTSARNTNDGIRAGANGTVRAFSNTITKNSIGMDVLNGGVIRSGGHNFVDGNATETVGTITPVPTM